MNIAQNLKDILPACGLCVLSVLLMAVVLVWPDSKARAYGVVMPPGMDELEVMTRVAAAGGRVVRYGASSSIVITDFGQEVERRDVSIPGALFLIQPLLLGGCQTSDAGKAALTGLATALPGREYEL
ncbi:MAG: hypothetical protein Alpg2KO_13190 [Alphaproteobacteria bacterium]